MTQNETSTLPVRSEDTGPGQNPARSEMIAVLRRVLQDAYTPDAWTLDLGMGAGLIETELFEAIPDFKVVGVDFSAEKLAQADQRLSTYHERFQRVEHDLSDLLTLTLPEHPYQFVIASQVLHYLSVDDMKLVYQYIHRTLAPEGLFLLLDEIRIHTPSLWDVYRSVWGHVNIAEVDETFEAHEQHLEKQEDYPVTLEQHLRWLRNARFEAAVLYLYGNHALFAARKLPDTALPSGD